MPGSPCWREEGALRKRSGDGGPFIVHMRFMDGEIREQRHTIFLGTVSSYDAAGHPPTEIVRCLQYNSAVSLPSPIVVFSKPVSIL